MEEQVRRVCEFCLRCKDAMMKSGFLIILPLLSFALAIGSPVPLLADSEIFISSLAEPVSDSTVFSRKDTIFIQDDTVKAALQNAFLVSPKDTFPLQVGAFKNKSNAEKISMGIKNLSGIKVRIIIEDGLYKVRVTRFPRIAEAEADNSADSSLVKIPESLSALTSDSVPAPPPDTIKYQPLEAATQKSEIDNGTSSYEGEIIFFKGDSPWLKRIKYFGESFTLVNALIITILFSICTMVILLVIILLNRRRLEMEEKRHQYLMEKYQSLIVDYPLWKRIPG